MSGGQSKGLPYSAQGWRRHGRDNKKAGVVTVLTQVSRTTLIAVFATMTACTIQLVSPYNSELEQKASAMEAEVSSWDLAMRQGAGRVDDDPRNPDNVKMLNKWRGEADALLTLMVSTDPGIVNCSEAAQAAYKAIESKIPEAVRPTTAPPSTLAHSGCEAELVADLHSGIDDVAKGLKYCQVSWIKDDYFLTLGSHQLSPPSPPSTVSSDEQTAFTRSCLAEFKESVGESAPGTGHGRAVSHLLTTLQVIVYVENRKKAAAAK
jgi:hypothetical protein